MYMSTKRTSTSRWALQKRVWGFLSSPKIGKPFSCYRKAFCCSATPSQRPWCKHIKGCGQIRKNLLIFTVNHIWVNVQSIQLFTWRSPKRFELYKNYNPPSASTTHSRSRQKLQTIQCQVSVYHLQCQWPELDGFGIPPHKKIVWDIYESHNRMLIWFRFSVCVHLLSP
jgi:hypothetical protein